MLVVESFLNARQDLVHCIKFIVDWLFCRNSPTSSLMSAFSSSTLAETRASTLVDVSQRTSLSMLFQCLQLFHLQIIIPHQWLKAKSEIQQRKRLPALLGDGNTTCLDMLGGRSNREETVASSQQARRTSEKRSLWYVACH